MTRIKYGVSAGFQIAVRDRGHRPDAANIQMLLNRNCINSPYSPTVANQIEPTATHLLLMMGEWEDDDGNKNV